MTAPSASRRAIAREQSRESALLSIRRRKRKQKGFKRRSSAQRFLTTYAAVDNDFATERDLNIGRYMRQLRERAAREWKIAAA